MCIFAECKTIFHAACPTSAMNHFRVKHKQTGKMNLKAQYCLTQVLVEKLCTIASIPSEQPCTVASIPSDSIRETGDVEPDSYDAAEIEALEQSDNMANIEDEDESSEYYLEYHSDYLNRLCHLSTSHRPPSKKFLMNIL